MKKDHIIQIKKLRFAYYESRSDFAKRLGLTMTAVANWETGKRFPSLANIKKMADLALAKNVPFNTDVFQREM